jgi:hypothetical protein
MVVVRVALHADDVLLPLVDSVDDGVRERRAARRLFRFILNRRGTLGDRIARLAGASFGLLGVVDGL